MPNETRKPAHESPQTGGGMIAASQTGMTPTAQTDSGGMIRATGEGSVVYEPQVASYWEGFGALLDFSPPPPMVSLPPGTPTALGFVQTGHALREAMTAFRKTK